MTRAAPSAARAAAPLLAALLLGAPAAADGPGAPDERLATAREQVQAGRLDEARDLLAGLLATDPDDLDARLLLAEVLLAGGQAQDAIDRLSSVDAPGDWRVAHGLGRALWARADELEAQRGPSDDSRFLLDLARAELSAAADHAPPDQTAPARAAAALLLDVFGDGAAAAAVADVALQRLGDGDPAALAELRLLRGTALARVYWSERDGGADDAARLTWTRAVEDLAAADAALPRDRVDAPWQLAWLHEQEGHAARAVDAALDVLDRAGPEAGAPLLFDLADRLAVADADHAPAAQAARALAALAARDPELVARPIRARRDQAVALALRLQWAALQGGGRDTRALLDAIMAAEPESAAAWNNYGLWLRDHRAYEESYAAYERAVALDASDPRILNDTAVLLHYYLERDADRAIELYERAFELADAALAADDLDPARRRDLEQARKDAQDNLRKLARGDRTPF